MTENRVTGDGEICWAAIMRCLKVAVDIAEVMPNGQRMIGEAFAAGLETVGAGSPRYEAFGNMREDARFWADVATPVEVEIYGAAALQRIARTDFAQRARKRVFWGLWQAMSEADRKAFLARVKEQED